LFILQITTTLVKVPLTTILPKRCFKPELGILSRDKGGSGIILIASNYTSTASIPEK